MISTTSSGAHCHARRRSVDNGGLSLALENNGLGQGWGGWEEEEMGSSGYAELLSDMRTHTLLAVNEHNTESSTPIELSNATRHRLIDSLDSWNFEPHKLPDEELLSCTLILFEVLYRIEGMEDEVGVSLGRISSFLRHLRQIYRSNNSYHNFQHALDVLQATHTFLCSAGMVPSVSILRDSDDRMWRPDKIRTGNALVSCLSRIDLFTIYIAAIGHDVGHPGFTNVFMKNAGTALSAVYDNKSALEQMHCMLLLVVMRCNGMAHLVEHSESDMPFRKLLSSSVLATDMSVHVDFMNRFKALIDGGYDNSSLTERKVLICQALIKCADISNPSRPHRVSQYWATALMEEWTAQASLEKHFHLPPTVQPSDDPLTEAKSQIFFINAFAKPLLELTSRAIPEMGVYARQCASNLQLWELRCAELTVKPDTKAGAGTDKKVVGPSAMLGRPEDYMTAFPLTLPSGCLLLQEESVAPMSWNSDLYSRSEGSASSSDVSSDSQCSGVHEVNGTCAVNHVSATLVYSPLSDPASPAESMRSFVLSPQSEVSSSRPCRAAVNVGMGVNGATSALRAAYEASVRKKKSFHRNSWNPSVPVSAAMVAAAAAAAAASTGAGVVSGKERMALLVSDAGSEAIVVARPARLETTFPPAAV